MCWCNALFVWTTLPRMSCCTCNEVIHLSASVKWMPVWTWKHVHVTHCKVVCTVSWHNGMLAPCYLLYDATASFQCRKIGSDDSAGRLSGAVPWLHVDRPLLKRHMHTLYLNNSDHDIYQWNRQVQTVRSGFKLKDVTLHETDKEGDHVRNVM